MPRCRDLVPHLPLAELGRRYRRARDPVERTHRQIVWPVAQGHRCPAVARLVGYSEDRVRTVVRRYNASGPAGLRDRRRANPGANPLLTAADRDALRAALAGPPPATEAASRASKTGAMRQRKAGRSGTRMYQA